MKYKNIVFTFLILLSVFTLKAQNTISFTGTNKKSVKLKANFTDYQILTISDNFNKVASNEMLKIELSKTYNFVLKENKLIANNHIITIKGENGIETKTLSEIGFDGRYFTNENISENNQLVLSIFKNAYTIYIKESEKAFYIEPLKKYDTSAKENQYIFYYEKDAIIPISASCGIKDAKRQVKKEKKVSRQKSGGCKEVELVFSADYSMYSTYNSIAGTINRTLEVLNLSEANFSMANGLSDDVHFKVVQHYIVTCDICNYWPTTLEIYTNYARFNTYASQLFTNHYDLKIHWQKQGGTGSVVGLGALDMCGTATGNGIGMAVVKNYASNTNYIRCILSHEIGHNFGCTHNTEIMRATVSGSNLWSAASITTIDSALISYTCLSDCNIDACDTKKVDDLVVTSDTTTNTINVSWLAENVVDFKVRLYSFATDTWTNYTTVSYPANTITYNYTQTHCNDKYKIDIVPVCNGIIGISEQVAINISDNVQAPTLVFGYLPDSICGGRTTYFNVSATDEGASPIYQWKINGVDVGTNAPNFSTNTLQNNDVLRCDLTSSATCVNSPYASVSTTVSVEQPTVLSVVIEASATTICTGDTITITATGTNIESEQPYYQWQLNGNYIQGNPTGNSGPSITVTPANNGDVYTCILYDGNACHTIAGQGSGNDGGAQSNDVTITILEPCTLANSEVEISGLQYYPNPVKNEFVIKANEEILEVSIYNLLGQTILNKKVLKKEVILDVSQLVESTYFVKIAAEKGTKIVKIRKD